MDDAERNLVVRTSKVLTKAAPTAEMRSSERALAIQIRDLLWRGPLTRTEIVRSLIGSVTDDTGVASLLLASEFRDWFSYDMNGATWSLAGPAPSVASAATPSAGASVEPPSLTTTRTVARGPAGRSMPEWFKRPPPAPVAPTVTAGARAAATPVEDPFPIGQHIGRRYRVTKLLGQGGMGRVYAAQDDELGRPVALKTVRTRSARDLAALRTEVRLLIQLDKPDFFPRVYEPFDHGGLLVVPMDLVDGITLREYIEMRQRHDIDRAVVMTLFGAVCERLHYLHNLPKGAVLFKDLKPSNVMVVPGTLDVRLIDFGLSAVAGERSLDGGTHGFWAPESERDGAYSVRSDVFALGRLLLCLLLGKGALAPGDEDVPTVPLGADRALPKALLDVARRLAAHALDERPASVRDGEDLAFDVLRRADAPAPEATQATFTCKTCGAIEPRAFYVCAGCGEWQKSLPEGRAIDLADGIREVFLKAATSALAHTSAPTSPHRVALIEQAARLRRTPPYEELMCLPHVEIEAYAYQIEAALTVLSRMRGRAILADEVGLGKTIEAGLVLKEYIVRREARRVLVVVPPGIRHQWRDELREKFLIAANVFGGAEADDTYDKRAIVAPATVLVISSHLARRDDWAARLCERDWDVVVLDEAHHAKVGSGSNQLGRFVSGLRTRRMLLLTATPAQNKLVELFQLVNLLAPGLLGGDRAGFEGRYGGTHRNWNVRRQDELKSLLREVMVRNRRADVHKAFPRRQADTQAVPLRPAELEAYRDVIGAAQEASLRGFELTTRAQQFCTSYRSLLASFDHPRLRALAAEPHFKLRFFLDQVAPELVEEPKVLVFSRFIESQREIADGLRLRGYAAVWATGSPVDRLRALAQFRDEPKAQYLVSPEPHRPPRACLRVRSDGVRQDGSGQSDRRGGRPARDPHACRGPQGRPVVPRARGGAAPHGGGRRARGAPRR